MSFEIDRTSCVGLPGRRGALVTPVRQLEGCQVGFSRWKSKDQSYRTGCPTFLLSWRLQRGNCQRDRKGNPFSLRLNQYLLKLVSSLSAFPWGKISCRHVFVLFGDLMCNRLSGHSQSLPSCHQNLSIQRGTKSHCKKELETLCLCTDLRSPFDT